MIELIAFALCVIVYRLGENALAAHGDPHTQNHEAWEDYETMKAIERDKS